MTLIVEKGSGVAGAVSYLALEEADTHFSALSHAAWQSAPVGLRENVLRQASSYVDFYEYPGAPLSMDQGLKWPRRAAADKDGRILSGLPHALRSAVLELASTYIEQPPGSIETRKILKEKVGPLELVYSASEHQPSFVYRLLLQIGARPRSNEIVRG
ncbi:hypothetical protein A9Q83_13630 [Alphaproteobacteria bacterium 46_93_T64]|nr:hypothetical protein A9Q83_13630 [Alphaproteobacteria bacterium 46_93_T64]